MKPYYDDGQITIYHGDCRDVLPVLKTPEIVVTDPPYGIGYQSACRENGLGLGSHERRE